MDKHVADSVSDVAVVRGLSSAKHHVTNRFSRRAHPFRHTCNACCRVNYSVMFADVAEHVANPPYKVIVVPGPPSAEHPVIGGADRHAGILEGQRKL